MKKKKVQQRRRRILTVLGLRPRDPIPPAIHHCAPQVCTESAAGQRAARVRGHRNLENNSHLEATEFGWWVGTVLFELSLEDEALEMLLKDDVQKHLQAI